MHKWTLTTLATMWQGARQSRTLALVVTFTRNGRERSGTVTGMGSMMGVNVGGDLFEDVRPSDVTWAEVTGPHLHAVSDNTSGNA